VGFRFFAQQRARAMGIAGEVWNRADGGVEIAAEHAESRTLDAFAEAVERGPGYVRDVLVEPSSERGFSDFGIGPSR